MKPRDGRRVILVDGAFKSMQGHYEGYNAAVASAASGQGCECVVVAHRDVQSKSLLEATLRPRLRFSANDQTSLAGDIAEELSAVLDELEAGPKDLVFMPSVGLADLAALKQLIEVKRLPASALHIVLRRDPAEYSTTDLIGVRAALLALHATNHAVLYADTDELASAYRAIGEGAVHCLPIPVSRAFHKLASQRYEEGTIAFLGDARIEKGFTTLPHIARQLVNRGYRLLIQANFNVPNGEPGIAMARDALADLTGVELVTQALAPSAYRDWLARAEIVALPYVASVYRSRSSGVFAEALAAGRPVVVPSGTWMERNLRGRGWSFADFASFADALPQDRSAARKQALQAAAGWSAHHSGEALVRTLLEAKAG